MSLAIGQNLGYINNIESGESLPLLSAIFYICDYLGISVSEFFDMEVKSPAGIDNILADLKKPDEQQLEAVENIIKGLIKNDKKIRQAPC